MSVTFRNNVNQTALPVRTWGAFMLGNGVGGAGVHWNAETWRFLPTDFTLKSHLTQRYGASFLPDDMTIQDWGVTFDDLEPHYDEFEYLCGTSGQAGNLNGDDPSRRQSVRGPALAALSDAAAKAGLRPHAVRGGRQAARLQAVPATVRESVAGLHQSARRHARTMHVLRLLRMVRLRQLFQGEPADHRAAGAPSQIEFRRRAPSAKSLASISTIPASARPASLMSILPARNSSSRPISFCCALFRCSMCSFCCFQASARPTIRRPDKARSDAISRIR